MNGKDEELRESMLSSELIYNGSVVHLYKDEVRLPDGKTAEREIVRHVGAVCIVPLTEAGGVIVERQYRYAQGKVLTELPAGKLDSKEEDRLSAAKRELREETGYTADTWKSLGEIIPTPGYSDETISLFLASGLHKGDQELDEDEFLHVTEEPLSFLYDEVMNGAVEDAKTQIGILRAAGMFLPCRDCAEDWDADDDEEIPDD